jgi:hypothetical protein
MKETWEMKDKVYEDFNKSGLESYSEFIKKEVKKLKPTYRKKKSLAI